MDAQPTEEIRVADMILAFDGRVLEVFGYIGSHGSLRFRAGYAHVTVDPLRKGRVSVIIEGGGPGSPAISFNVEPEEAAAAAPFFDLLRTACP